MKVSVFDCTRRFVSFALACVFASLGFSATHTVGKGETYYSISKKYGISVDQLCSANGLTKNIEDVNYNDLLLVWNYETGSYTYEYPIWIEKENYSDNYFKISFEDGTNLKVVENHALFNADINE